MTNNKLQMQLATEICNVEDTLKALRDGVTGDTEAIINEMLKHVTVLHRASYELSNREEIYKH